MNQGTNGLGGGLALLPNGCHHALTPVPRERPSVAGTLPTWPGLPPTEVSVNLALDKDPPSSAGATGDDGTCFSLGG